MVCGSFLPCCYEDLLIHSRPVRLLACMLDSSFLLPLNLKSLSFNRANIKLLKCFLGLRQVIAAVVVIVIAAVVVIVAAGYVFFW
jgi:hypothetical protein